MPQENCLGEQVGEGPLGQARGDGELPEVGRAPVGKALVLSWGSATPGSVGAGNHGGLTAVRLIRAIQAVLLPITDHGCIHTAQGITEELVRGAQEPGQGWLWWGARAVVGAGGTSGTPGPSPPTPQCSQPAASCALSPHHPRDIHIPTPVVPDAGEVVPPSDLMQGWCQVMPPYQQMLEWGPQWGAWAVQVVPSQGVTPLPLPCQVMGDQQRVAPWG